MSDLSSIFNSISQDAKNIYQKANEGAAKLSRISKYIKTFFITLSGAASLVCLRNISDPDPTYSYISFFFMLVATFLKIGDTIYDTDKKCAMLTSIASNMQRIENDSLAFKTKDRSLDNIVNMFNQDIESTKKLIYYTDVPAITEQKKQSLQELGITVLEGESKQ